MPIDNSVPVWPSPFVSREGQVPLTRFLPMESGVDVQISEVSVPSDLTEFVGACHRASLESRHDLSEDKEAVIANIGKGKTLWQCGEVITFGIRLSNVSRVFTHQLVRARVGVSFSQQCTGDVDCRHSDVIVPNPLYQFDRRSLLRNYIREVLNAKVLYSEMIADGMSLQEARYILPAGLAGHIHMRICLGALSELYKKRSCTMTQTWEMIVFADKLREQIKSKAPWALPMFTSCRDSATANCWFKGSRSVPFANTHLWKPDLNHDDSVPYNIASFVHQKTHREISSGPDGSIIYFHGLGETDESGWRDQARRVGLVS